MTLAARICALAATGMTAPEIAAEVGCWPQYVHVACRRADVPLTPDPRRRPREAAGDAMLLTYERCRNYSAVAHAFAVSPCAVWKAVQRRRDGVVA